MIRQTYLHLPEIINLPIHCPSILRSPSVFTGFLPKDCFEIRLHHQLWRHRRPKFLECLKLRCRSITM